MKVNSSMKKGSSFRQSKMKRSGFKREPRKVRQLHDSNDMQNLDSKLAQPLPQITQQRSVIKRIDDVVCAQTKVVPVEHSGYRRLVAMLPCIMCGISGHSQAAHPNTGKGMGTKTDDRLCFPLCAPRPGIPGCHSRFDQGALLTKEERRNAEPEFGRRTRAVIDSVGLWPENLPRWIPDLQASND